MNKIFEPCLVLIMIFPTLLISLFYFLIDLVILIITSIQLRAFVIIHPFNCKIYKNEFPLGIFKKNLFLFNMSAYQLDITNLMDQRFSYFLQKAIQTFMLNLYYLNVHIYIYKLTFSMKNLILTQLDQYQFVINNSLYLLSIIR